MYLRMRQQNTPLQASNSSPTVEIVEIVADREGVDATELPPLGSVIDPDALNSLFAYSPDGAPQSQGYVVFQYCGYSVAVHSDGQIILEE